MMELQLNDVDLEEGELSESDDDGIYTPLQRPAPTPAPAPGTSAESVASPHTTCHQTQTAALDDDESQTNSDSSSGESSEEGCIKKLRTDDPDSGHKKRKKRIKRTVMRRVAPTDTEMLPNRTRFKKYNVWTAALQEDALSENMRGCDVTRSRRDRNVENYDFSLRYRLNGENRLKRRLSNSSEDEAASHPTHKRGRPSSRPTEEEFSQRGSVKSRLGHRTRRGASSTSGSSDNSCEPRHILDLNDIAGRDPSDLATEMASKLYEEKDELLIRVVAVLGMDLPLELYKETQRIEADGGMMIKNGRRRRTPGGVFLFLLKHHDNITPEQQKSIFDEDRQNMNKSRKQIETLMRNRKVEELKKCLSKQSTELASLCQRKEHYMQADELSAESQPGNVSNPPPSPVGHEQESPEYKTHEININHVDNAELPSTSKAAALASSVGLKELVSYDDDFLDVNCGEMDFF
ncbi:GL17621 [Drosophila persimilis]|uniref:Phosphorylated adapter RNA export protein n=1 Tax=Drosophila persimilis TaxID=7234 RepID=B4GHZ4_DROPE|nr:phosphorylated adapter RNA export protein [Drosophila persimilis]EDW36114.1 GL17621 [Drosophila persimilis]